MARQLVDGFRADGAKKQFLTQITWYIVINVNPDGYEFTFNVSFCINLLSTYPDPFQEKNFRVTECGEKLDLRLIIRHVSELTLIETGTPIGLKRELQGQKIKK